MKIDKKVEFVMIAYTLLTSPVAGLMTLGYVLMNKQRIKELENRIKSLDDCNETVDKGGLEDIQFLIQPSQLPTSLINHKGCLIENYNNQIFLIMKPSGAKLQKTFLTLENAQKEIDFVAPFLKEQTYEKRKVHNVRYVR